MLVLALALLCESEEEVGERESSCSPYKTLC